MATSNNKPHITSYGRMVQRSNPNKKSPNFPFIFQQFYQPNSLISLATRLQEPGGYLLNHGRTYTGSCHRAGLICQGWYVLLPLPQSVR